MLQKTKIKSCVWHLFQVEVLKKAMLKERDKLRAERENLQAEELRACKEGMDVLEERLQSCEKEWQAKLAAQADEWGARLASYQRDVEAERDKMAQALAGNVMPWFNIFLL